MQKEFSLKSWEEAIEAKGNPNHSSVNGQFISGTSTGAGETLPKDFAKGATFSALKPYPGDVVSLGEGKELRANPHQFAMTTTNGTKYRATQIEPLRTKRENYTAKEIENNALRASSMAKALGASDIIHPVAVAQDEKGTRYLVEDHSQTTGARMPGSEEGRAAVEKMSGDDALRNIAVQYLTALGDRSDGNNIRVEKDGTVSHINSHHGPNAKNPIDDGWKMQNNNYLLRQKKDSPITEAGIHAIKDLVAKSKEALKAAEPYTSKEELTAISKRFGRLSETASVLNKRGLRSPKVTVQDFFDDITLSLNPYVTSPRR